MRNNTTCSSRAEVEIVRSNIDVLVKEGLGLRAEQDYGLAAETCTVLLKLAGTHKVRSLWTGHCFCALHYLTTVMI